MIFQKVRKSIVWILLISLLCSISVSAAEEKITAYQHPAHLSVNGIFIDAPCYLIDTTMYVPLRAVSESFGYSIQWNEDRSIDLTAAKSQEPKYTEIAYQAPPSPKVASFMVHKDDLIIRVNGEAVPTPHFLYKGTTYAPLSFFYNVLNCHVYQNSSLGVLKIYSPDFVTFQENDAFYYDGQMLTKEQFDEVIKLMIYAMGATDLTPESAETELTYLKGGTLVSERITDDANFQSFMEKNQLDALLKELNIQNVELLKETILKPIFYQYEINNNNAMAYYTPTEEDLQAQLKDSIYANGHWMKAKHILIMKTEDDSGKKQAEALLKQVKNNPADFDKLMAEFSQDPGSKTYPDGYLFKEGDMVTEFYEGALALTEGGISEIVESQYGYHIIFKVKDYENGVPYTEVKDELHLAFAQKMFFSDMERACAYVNTVLNRNYLEH